MKKKYWKAASVLVLGLSVSLVLLTGCSKEETKSNSSSNSSETTQSFVLQDADNLLLNVSEVKVAKTEDKNKKVILTMDIENNGLEGKDIGSIDFYLEADGKEYKIDANSNNFGESVDLGKELKKNLTFVIPEKLTKAKLVYRPADKVLAEWEIEIPSPNE